MLLSYLLGVILVAGSNYVEIYELLPVHTLSFGFTSRSA
jgi:hypothetical protein